MFVGRMYCRIIAIDINVYPVSILRHIVYEENKQNWAQNGSLGYRLKC